MIALVTSAPWPDGSADDFLLTPVLRSLGLDLQHEVWNDPDVSWTSFDAVVLRSCWDYHLKIADFEAWLGTMVRLGVRLLNPVTCVLWNADKKYLRDLAAKGVRIPPTLWVSQGSTVTLHDIMANENWGVVVAKPSVSASAYETRMVTSDQAAASEPWFYELVTARDVIVQKFMPEVAAVGETSLVYFKNEFSHAVCKFPRTGDFRTQDELGGFYHPIVPAGPVIRWGQDILKEIGQQLLYARVDAIMVGEEPVLTELELIEPDLYLDTSQEGLHRFAQAIQDFSFRI